MRHYPDPDNLLNVVWWLLRFLRAVTAKYVWTGSGD